MKIELRGPSGEVAKSRQERGGGPPYWWSAKFEVGERGRYTALLYTVNFLGSKKILDSREITVPSEEAPENPGRSIWTVEARWDRGTENLYSAWLEALFHDDDERAAWKALHEVTRNPEKNLLYDHLGLGEDDARSKNAVTMDPDCADNPYFLRAYFAWKLRLPFGFSECSRGTLYKAPQCKRWFTNSIKRSAKSEALAFGSFLRLIMDTIQSGSSRALLDDEDSDFYPLPLSRRDLKPGVVFADCYGHTLVLVRWIPQTDDHPGQLLAVDAQPDGTVGIKRFWRGNFLFATSEVIGAPGFKAFRPIIQDKGRLRLLRNHEIARSADYGNFSLQQKNMPALAFYDMVERLINPKPLEPASALADLFKAFHEQLLVRVLSVSNGEDYARTHPGTVIPMPRGLSIFETKGLWEDFSTPNRDLRLLIAIDTILEFPGKVAKSSGQFKLPKEQTSSEIKKTLEDLLRQWARELTITYTKSNGASQTLTLEEILNRKEAFEMAYNPNDCAEVRWGAPEGSAERVSCNRRAPEFQQQRMRAMREWFRRRFRPVE